MTTFYILLGEEINKVRDLLLKTDDLAYQTENYTKELEMFAMRTPTKPVDVAECGARAAPIQPQTSTAAIRRSTGGVEAAILDPEKTKKAKAYKTRASEAAALQQSALAQLDSARNLKGEIKSAVTAVVRRLYELIREAEARPKTQPEKTANKTFTLDPALPVPGDVMDRLEVQIKRLEETGDKLREAIQEREADVMKNAIATYAQAVASQNDPKKEMAKNDPKEKRTLHSIVVAPKNATDTADMTMTHIRGLLKAKQEGVQIDKIRKAKDGKVVVGCRTEEERRRIKECLEKGREQITVKDATNRNPLVKIKNILNCNTLGDIEQALRNQNRSVTAHIQKEDWVMVEKYRRRARNLHESHIVLQVTPNMWKALTNAQKIHVDLQRVWVEDQTPLVQCTMCLGYGHTRRRCDMTECVCSHCGDKHQRAECPKYKEGVEPKCVNCKNAKMEDTNHNAFSAECQIKRKWDKVARASIAYC